MDFITYLQFSGTQQISQKFWLPFHNELEIRSEEQPAIKKKINLHLISSFLIVSVISCDIASNCIRIIASFYIHLPNTLFKYLVHLQVLFLGFLGRSSYTFCCVKTTSLTSSDFLSLIITSLYGAKKRLWRPFIGHIFLYIITETNGAYEREDESIQIE